MKIMNYILNGKFSFILILLLCQMLNGCMTKKSFSAKTQKVHFLSSITQIGDLLDIDGFYTSDAQQFTWEFRNQFCLYEDGSYINFRWDYDNKHEKEGMKVKEYKLYIDSLISANAIDISKYSYRVVHYIGFSNEKFEYMGGAFSIDKNGNLILEQPCQLNDHIWLLRNYFRIQDRQTLIREKCQFVSDDSIINFDTIAVFHFVPAQNKLDPFLNYAKRKKYMWRSKKEWKEYRVARKEYYRKLKYEAKQNDTE